MFAVKPIGSAVFPTVARRDPRENETTWEAVLQGYRTIKNSAKDVSRSVTQEGYALQQATGKGLFDVASFVPEIFKYTYLYGPSAEWGPVIWGAIGGSEEYYEKALEQGSKRVQARRNIGNMGEAIDWWDTWKKDMDKAYMEHPVWQGVDYKKRFSGRVAKLFAEESVESRLFALAKFARGRRIFKGVAGPLNFDNPESIAETLDISVSEAARRIERHKLGFDKGLQNAYMLAETESGLNFALAFSRLEQLDEQGNPVPTLSGMGIQFAGGLLAAIARPTRLIEKAAHGRYNVVDFLYKIKDRYRKTPLTPDEKYNRQRMYLLSKRVPKNIIDDIYTREGTLENAATQYLIQAEHGDLRKLLVHINNMPTKEREQLVKMAEVSFEALSQVRIAGAEAGVNIDIFSDYILNLSRLNQLKDQIFATKHGILSPIWGKVMRTEYEKIKQNEERIQETLVKMLEKLKTHVKRPEGRDYDPAVQKHLEEFVSWATGVTNRQQADTRITFNQAQAEKDIEMSKLSLTEQTATTKAVNEIVPVGSSKDDMLDNANVRSEKLERQLVGRKAGDAVDEIGPDGLPVLGPDGLPLPAKGMYQKSLDTIQDEVFDKIDFSIRIPTRTTTINSSGEEETVDFLGELYEKYSRNPDLNDKFIDLFTTGITSAKTRQLINTVLTGNINRLTLNDLDGPDGLKEAYRAQISKDYGDTSIELQKFNDEMALSNPREQLQFIARNLKASPLSSAKIGMIPSTMSLVEIKRFNTYLNNMAIKASGEEGVMYREIRTALNEMLDEGEISLKNQGVDAKDIQRYKDSKAIWKHHAKVWINSPMQKFLSGEYPASSVFADVFLGDARFIQNNFEIFQELKRGTPIGRKADGTIEYKPPTEEELKMLDDGIRYAIAQGIHNGTTDSLQHLQNILATYGSLERKGKNILTEEGEQAIAHLIHVRSGAIEPMNEMAKNRLKDIERQSADMNKLQNAAISDSFFGQLSSQGKDGSVASITEWLTNPFQIVKRAELTTDQVKGFDDLILKKYSDAVNPDEIIITPLEYLKLKTNNFKTDEGKKIKENLNALLIESVVHAVVIRTSSKQITDDVMGVSKLSIGKKVDPVELDELIERIGTIRAEIFGDEANSLIDVVHQGAIARMSSQALSESLGEALPKGYTASNLLSRVFALQRGVIGLRYIIGEATFKELRKGQSKEVRRLLSDPDAAAGLLAMMGDPLLSAEGRTILGVKSLHWGSAIRALAYVTGLKFGDAVRLFTEEEAKTAFEKGIVPDAVLGKALAFSTLQKRTKRHFGGGKLFEQKAGVPPTKSAKERYKEQQTVKLRDEMDTLFG